MANNIKGIKTYNVLETAKELGVTPQTVRLWIKQGKLKGGRIGRPILITEENLSQFVKQTLLP